MTASRNSFLIILFSAFLIGPTSYLEGPQSTRALLRPVPDTNKTSSENLIIKWLNRAAEEAKNIRDVYWRDVFLWRVAKAQASTSNLAGAMATVQAITDAKIRDLAYSGIAKAQARNLNFAGAKATADRVRSNASLYLNILQTIAEAGGIAEAEAMAKVHSSLDYTAHANFYISKAYAKSGEFSKAKMIAEKLRHPHSSSQACFRSMINAYIAHAHAKANNRKRYRESITSAKTYAKLVATDQEGELNYRIVKLQVDSEDFTGAIKTANSISDAYYKSLAYKSIVTAMSDVNDITNAKAIVERICETNLKDSAYLSILKKQVSLGNSKGAESTAKFISEKNARSKALQEIAIVRGDFVAARTIADSLVEPDERSNAYRRVALAQAQAGDFDNYREMITLAIEAAKAYKHPKYTSRPSIKPALFNSIVRVQVDVGDFEAAIDTAALISTSSNVFSSDIRFSAFRHIAKALAQADKITYLQTWINSLRNLPDRIAALLGAADGL